LRRIHRTDASQAAIVEGLRNAGYRVEIIERPVDLLVGRWIYYYDTFRWWLLELKTPTKTGKIRKRKDQEKQDLFIKETGTAVVSTLEEALKALKETA
jgi:hypothetical protein